MAHHGRGLQKTKYAYRRHPRRDQVMLQNRAGQDLAVIADAPWGGVSQQDAVVVVNLQNESRTWKLPVHQCGEYRPVTNYRIRSLSDNSLWEILSVPRETNSLYQCVCTRMNEHDSEVP